MFENASPDMTAMRKLNLVFRFSYTLPFVLSSIAGLVLASGHEAPALVYATIPVSVMFMAVFVNFSNDYFDHGNGVDAARYRNTLENSDRSDEMLKKLYWEGNQFDNGNVSESEGRRLMIFIVAMAVVFAVPAVLFNPLPALVFGGVGLFFAYFYTAPPINFGARGLGEALVAASFFMLTFCPYYIIAEGVSPEILLVSLIVALTVGLMRAVDSMTAQEVHIQLGERSIATIFGKDAVAVLVRAVILAVYAITIVLAVVSGPIFLLEFLTLPLALKAWRTVVRKEKAWDFACAPLAFGMAVFSQVALIAAGALTVFI